MDSLILSFNKKQMLLYKELLTKENIELNFDTDMPKVDKFYIICFDEIISSMENEAKILFKLKKVTSPFVSSFNQEEIKELTPVYYNALLKIKRQADIIRGEAFKLSSKIGEIDRALADINKRYANFLPYKAALYNREAYSTKIYEIDSQFQKNIDALNNLKKELLSLFEKSEKISNIVDDFIQRSSKATDEPNFKNFNYNDFFWTVEAFLERIKNVSNK